MADPKKRIVVDGVEFGNLFYFPRVLRSVTGAMQPPRLVVALLMVVVLVVCGRTWDAIAGHTVGPGGILAGEPSIEQAALGQEVLWSSLEDYGVTSPWPRERLLDAYEVLPLIEAGYRQRRAAKMGAAGSAETAVRADDERFLADRARLLRVAPVGAFEATVVLVRSVLTRTVQGIVLLRPHLVLEAGGDLFVRLPAALWQRERAFALVFGAVFLLVTAIGGGALCRMAACDFAGQERLRVREALEFAVGNWGKLVLTPVLPLLLAGGLALVMVVLGLFLAPWLDVVGGVLYGVAMILGLVLAFLLIGYAIGFPLLIPAVACENCDAADAQQRTYAYLLNRPLHLVGYGATGLVGLALGYVVVGLVGATTLNFTAALVGTFTSNSALSAAGGFSLFALDAGSAGGIHASWHSGWAAAMVSFWQRVVVDLIAAYVVAYLFSACTITYLLMRRACDGQDVEEIWRPGLMPGTLVPLPRPRVSRAAAVDDVDAGMEPKDAEGALRYGGSAGPDPSGSPDHPEQVDEDSVGDPVGGSVRSP